MYKRQGLFVISSSSLREWNTLTEIPVTDISQVKKVGFLGVNTTLMRFLKIGKYIKDYYKKLDLLMTYKELSEVNHIPSTKIEIVNHHLNWVTHGESSFMLA